MCQYQSASVSTSGGRYNNLKVAPLSAGYDGLSIEFYVNGIRAREGDTFSAGAFNLSFDLTVTTD
jgi:hypothetical protein